MKVILEREILLENEHQAEQNRARFGKTLVINIIGSPGCGKTTLLEKTIDVLSNELRMAVIEGDIYTTKDAERIENRGVPVVQINTAGGCHLSAEVISCAVEELNPAGTDIDILFIENVGNLVCPAEFDLGEDYKVAVLSIAEGDDKPAKYPLLFQEAGLVLLNKCDLLPYTNFNINSAMYDIRGLNPAAPIFHLSAVQNEGMEGWLSWLRYEVKKKEV